MDIELHDDIIIEFGEEFEEGSVEYKASQDIKKLLSYIPGNGNELDYMRAVSNAYEHYLIMEEKSNNLQDTTYEAEYVSGIVFEFFFENTTEV